MSKFILFTKDNRIYSNSLQIIDQFFEAGITVGILAKQSTLDVLRSQIPEQYEKEEKIQLLPRGNDDLKAEIRKLRRSDAIISILGFVQEDAIFSFNCKIPLFNPQPMVEKESDINIDSKVIDYGLPILDFQDIIDCYKAFDINKDSYFKFEESDKFSVISINNANTMGMNRDEEEIRIKKIFETNLKADSHSREQIVLLCLLFQLIHKVVSDKQFDSVEFWGTFPSSTYGKVDTSASFLKEAIRWIVGGNPRAKKGVPTEIFIRHSSMKSKHSSGSCRLSNKCDRDFDTLILNPVLKGKLVGKVVCIIDDYITNGYSAEAAKHILFQAGVSRVIFLSMGKFGYKYFQTNYQINGDVTSAPYPFDFEGEKELGRNSTGISYNQNNDKGILEFGELF
ncbi:phosphoribosyltransferase [Lactococcus lactis]|uniref:phosphoribosyltransferase n=1 Tax=Lactococcus lactis TaxID=1358 RepID=UPI001F3620AF|nr:phosphoribosyl transferase [Lactococcus lactis]